MVDQRTVSFSVRVDVNVTPELAEKFTALCVGELAVIEREDFSDRSLGWLVARLFDRQENPLQILAEIDDPELAWDWFGEEVQ